MQEDIYFNTNKSRNSRGLYDLLRSTVTTPDAPTRIRQRIARLLDDRGMTQRAFAKKVGHGDQWASNLLSGRSSLTWEDLDRVASVLRVPPSELVRMSEDAWELTPSEMRIVRALRMLPPTVRDQLILMADYLVGVTPDEVDLLSSIRTLTADERSKVEHYIRVVLLTQGAPHRTTTPAGHPTTAQTPTTPDARTRTGRGK